MVLLNLLSIPVYGISCWLIIYDVFIHVFEILRFLHIYIVVVCLEVCLLFVVRLLSSSIELAVFIIQSDWLWFLILTIEIILRYAGAIMILTENSSWNICCSDTCPRRCCSLINWWNASTFPIASYIWLRIFIFACTKQVRRFSKIHPWLSLLLQVSLSKPLYRALLLNILGLVGLATIWPLRYMLRLLTLAVPLINDEILDLTVFLLDILAC